MPRGWPQTAACAVLRRWSRGAQGKPVIGPVLGDVGHPASSAGAGPVQPRRNVLAGLGSLGLALCGLPGSSQAQLGDYQDDTWTDAARSRAVPVRIRIPASPGPWPAVLFSHGLGGSRSGADVWGRAWQAAGLLVLHLQHAGSDIDVARVGGMTALRRAGTAEQLLARVADVGFVLDEILRRHAADLPIWSAVQAERMGMAGHSFGAQTVQALAGQRYPVPGSWREPRLAAFLALSCRPSSASSLSLREQFGSIDQPFLAATGSLDGDPLGGALTGASRASVYDGLPPGQRALLWLEDADHMSFAGNASPRINGRGGVERAAQAWALEARHHEVVAEVTTLWWQSALSVSAEGRSRAAADLRRVSLASAGDRLRLG